MSQNRSIPLWKSTAVVAVLGCLAAGVLPLGLAPPRAEALGVANELPPELRYVPADAAYFLYVDVAAIWGHPVAQSIRKADQSFIEELVGNGKKLFGVTPDQVKRVVVFAPNLRNPRDLDKFGVVVTFTKVYDTAALQKGVEQLLPKNVPVKVAGVNDHTALILVNLGNEYAQPRPADASGPLTAALKEAASGRHTVVGGLTMENLPEPLRADDIPAPFRPFQPIFKATSLTATLDLGKSIDINVRVKTGTANQAIDCEKSAGVLLALVQDSLNEGLKEFDKARDPAFKDLSTVMKAIVNASRGAKFSTLGTDMSVSVSIPTDLPFAGAYLAAKQKTMDAAASASSANNLKQIALATINYADINNSTLPPAAVCDKTGKPLLSWRVLILPYIEQDNLYKQFKLDEPWDSPNNKKLLARMPKTYAIPGKTKPGDTDTYYRVFVGNGAGFDWVRGMRFPADFQDGTSNTIMCVTAENAVPWTKPDELEFDPDKDMTRLVGRVVNGKFQFAMFDGSVRTLAKIPPKMTLNFLITRAGGEVIPNDFDR